MKDLPVTTTPPPADSDWRSLRGAFGKSGLLVAEIMAENRREELAHEERKFGLLRKNRQPAEEPDPPAG